MMLPPLSTSPPDPPWIMILDSSPTVCRVLELILTQAGWQALAFQEPFAALQYLHQHQATPPAALILEIELPHLDGLAVVCMLRSTASWRTLPILALTAHDGTLDRVKAKLAGINGLLAKPFRAQDLIERFHSLLARYAESPEPCALSEPEDRRDQPPVRPDEREPQGEGGTQHVLASHVPPRQRKPLLTRLRLVRPDGEPP